MVPDEKKQWSFSCFASVKSAVGRMLQRTGASCMSQCHVSSASSRDLNIFYILELINSDSVHTKLL